MEGEFEGKTAAARRSVPLTATLRDMLVEHRLASDEPPDDSLVFGRTDRDPFIPSTVDNRAKRAWKEAKLRGLTLHEARHTFASICIAARVNSKALSVYLRHSNVGITFDTYGHLMPGTRPSRRVSSTATSGVPVSQRRASQEPVGASRERS